MSSNNGVGTVLITVAQLQARFGKEGSFSVHVTPNGQRSNMVSPVPITFGPTGKTSKPVWHNPKRMITLPAGTYFLMLQVFHHSSRKKVELVGEVRELPLHQLSSEQPTAVDLVAPSTSSAVGDITLLLQPFLPTVPGGVNLAPYHQTRVRLALMASILTIFQDLTSLGKSLGADYSAMGLSSAYSYAIISYLHHDYTTYPDDRRVPEDNPIWDLVRQVKLQLHHFSTMYWPASRTNDHAASSLAKELIPAVGRSLVLVFGFVDCYKTTGYEFIESLSQTSGSMFSRLLFQLLAMGAQMRGLCDRTPRAFTDEDKDEFLCALARQYAKKFTGERAPSGPWIEFMDCMYGRAAVRMLNAFKRVIDETDHRPQDARFRSAARRLMTTLARDSRMLPSALHIEESRITFPSRNPFAPAAVKDAMRAGSGKDTGTSSIVSFGSMSCQKRKRIEVAIKGLTKSLGEKIVEDTYLEIIAGWTLRHERLLPTLGIVHYLEMLSIVSERMAGGNVRNYINTSNDFGRLPEGKRIAKLNFWLKQVAEGLKYMHDEGMAHGDLRGKNILIDSESDPGCNRIVIADFGLSLYVESISQAYKSTRVGNPRYLAPELQLRHNDVDDAAGKIVVRLAAGSKHSGAPSSGQHPSTSSVGISSEIRALFSGPKFRISPSSRQNEASDLFSFAMLCVELYTGQEPFVASHPSAADWQVSNLILQGMRPTPLPTAIAAQPGLVRALERCWQQNPLHRGDAAALLADIGSLA